MTTPLFVIVAAILAVTCIVLASSLIRLHRRHRRLRKTFLRVVWERDEARLGKSELPHG